MQRLTEALHLNNQRVKRTKVLPALCLRQQYSKPTDGSYSDADGRSLDLQCQNRIGKNGFNLNRNIRIKLLLIGKGLPTPVGQIFHSIKQKEVQMSNKERRKINNLQTLLEKRNMVIAMLWRVKSFAYTCSYV
ncbi:hypothetical protein TNIN_92051 [Trichonephila inaurata madagascariensis]|uniref:Uncharacterized protein n=1 Tax=Trichonephila inaurata madagascariensis TaxID=2747483 RepID=A0A8X6IIK8_9ARAC|nr:hypothetical protein TNIN_92051 [Trichonephila inaurata madagascariensis]